MGRRLKLPNYHSRLALCNLLQTQFMSLPDNFFAQKSKFTENLEITPYADWVKGRYYVKVTSKPEINPLNLRRSLEVANLSFFQMPPLRYLFQIERAHGTNINLQKWWWHYIGGPENSPLNLRRRVEVTNLPSS
ncbi:hypothetical protein CEXT_697601 [Caerostris extrusa]|uniref:LAGLIDADG homing endonuclease n=1 Tax=Caerostris extrusa TaxID=172846 RepID=A0AAV4X3D9_CAEEX|nr:hypothetical protein CEXT_697601 [Caerostris extrusa]